MEISPLPDPKTELNSVITPMWSGGKSSAFSPMAGVRTVLFSGPIIHLHGAWICGETPLDLRYASIPYALYFSNCHFAVSVVMQYAECAALYLDGSRLAQGLRADGLVTKGAVYLRRNFSAEGEVRLLGANIGGNLDCGGGRFNNPGKYALSTDSLTTKGDVNLGDSFSAEGMVRLIGANIGGILSCVNGEFHNPNGTALLADGLTTKGDVYLMQGFSANGEVRLPGAKIGGGLFCNGREVSQYERICASC